MRCTLRILLALVLSIALLDRAEAQFSGEVEGHAFTTINGGQLFIVGMKVELLKKDAFADTVLAEDVTDEGGDFHLAFDDSSGGSEIEIYLKFIAENEDGSIRVRKKLIASKKTRTEDFRKDNPILVQANTFLSEDLGDVPLDPVETKPQLLHWTNRCKQFIEDQVSSNAFSFPAGQNGILDILTIPEGGSTSFYFPGGFQTELIAALIALYGTGVGAVGAILPGLGTILGGVAVVVDVAITAYVNTQFSDQDAIYISDISETNENTVYHEFGHFLMWHLQNESWLNPIDASFSRHFTIANNPNSKLAWTEGFPNGFAMIVDAWCQDDDGEYGLDTGDDYEDLTSFSPHTAIFAIGCAGAGATCSGQALSHGYVSEWYTGTTLYDLWDGPNNLTLRGGLVAAEEYEDPVTVTDPLTGASSTTTNDHVELSFADIIQPLLNNQGTGGFHNLFNNQEQFLINNFIQYHEELLALTLTGEPLDDLAECDLERDITDLFHYNGIRNLHASVGTATFPAHIWRDFLNTDDISFVRDVETEFYVLDSSGVFVPDRTVFQTFEVDVTELFDGNDDYNYSSDAASDFSGELRDDLLVTGTVSDGSATLSFNHNAVYGWQFATNSYAEPLSGLPTVETEFHVSLCGGMTLEAREGGAISVGDPSTIHSAEVTVERGGALVLGGGRQGQVLEREFLPNGPLVSKGRLVIHPNSRVVIERDATLQINPGAEIVLIGPNAVLEIRGDLVITADATFTYTSAGGGHVLFDLPDGGGLPNVTMDSSAKIVLDEVPFTVAFDSYVRPDDISGPEFTITDATGSFQNNAYIDVSQSIFTLEDSFIILDNGAARHGGIVLNGAQHVIFNNEISGGAPGISANNTAGSNQLVIGSTVFSNCGTAIEVTDLDTSLSAVTISTSGIGLRTERGTIDLYETDFFSCGIGWWGTEHSGSSRMRQGSVNNCNQYGLQVEVLPGGDVTLKNMTVSDNEVGAWADGGGRLVLKSTKVRLSAKSGLLLSGGAVLDIDNNAFNTFSRNPISIELDGAGIPLLANGQNVFYPESLAVDGLTIAGTTNYGLDCLDPLFNPDIAAGGNTWNFSYNQVTQVWTGGALTTSPYDIESGLGCSHVLVP